MDGVWLQWLADKAWAIALIVGGALVRLYIKVAKNDARIIALESGHSSVVKKIDSNQREIMQTIEALRKEVKDDYRMVVTSLLEKVPKA